MSLDLPLSAEFEQFVSDSGDLLQGSLLVARVINPEANTQAACEQIEALARQIGASSAEQVVGGLRQNGFRGDRDTYYRIENSCIDEVLKSKKGIPITLAVVCIEVSRRNGGSAHGINFPQHFLVFIENQMVDPFNLALRPIEECRRWAVSNGFDPRAALQPASNVAIVVRMLNNIRLNAQAAHDSAKVLELLDYQQILSPQDFSLYLDRAEAWIRLDNPAMARECYESAHALAPTDSFRKRIAARIEELGETDEGLN